MRVRRGHAADPSQVPSRTPDGVGDTQHQLHRHGACPVARWRTITPIVRRIGHSSTATPSPAAVSAVPDLTPTAVESEHSQQQQQHLSRRDARVRHGHAADPSQVPSRTPDGVGDAQHQLHRHGVCRVAHWRTITPIVRCESATAAQPRQTSPAAVSVLLELTMTAVE